MFLGAVFAFLYVWIVGSCCGRNRNFRVILEARVLEEWVLYDLSFGFVCFGVSSFAAELVSAPVWKK